jgi:hypothetical protein
MQHPLESISIPYRKRFFFTFLFLALVIFAIFRVLDQPLRTDAAPNGIVSFELAGDPITAKAITDSWKQLSILLSAVAGKPNPDIVNTPYVLAAFELGLDYLFMPLYALAFAFGTLLVSQKHQGWIQSLAILAGYGAFAAALFDAVENYSLLNVLLGAYQSSYPAIAAFCASAKFGLLIIGLLVGLMGWILPKK